MPRVQNLVSPQYGGAHVEALLTGSSSCRPPRDITSKRANAPASTPTSLHSEAFPFIRGSGVLTRGNNTFPYKSKPLLAPPDFGNSLNGDQWFSITPRTANHHVPFQRSIPSVKGTSRGLLIPPSAIPYLQRGSQGRAHCVNHDAHTQEPGFREIAGTYCGREFQCANFLSKILARMETHDQHSKFLYMEIVTPVL